MKKGLVGTLVGIAMFLAFLLPTTVWAQKVPGLPAGARLIKPTTLYKVDEAGRRTRVDMPTAPSAVLPSHDDGRISEPYIFAYTMPGTKGARLGVGASSSFPITGFDVWADGQRVGATVATFFAGTVPSLVPGQGIEQDLSFRTPEILRVGEHEVEVHVYPDYPRSNMHFEGLFDFEVQWFEFGVWGCLSDRQTVQLQYGISAIGPMPKQVVVSANGEATLPLDVVDNVATLEISAATYRVLLGGQELPTTIRDGDYADRRSATHLLWYPIFEDIPTCGSGGGGGGKG